MYLGSLSFLEEEASALSSRSPSGALMTYAGIKRFAAGKTITGIIVGGIGAIMLICSLPFVVGIALAAAMVYYGWKLMKNGSADSGVSSFDPEPASAAYQSHFDDEWEEFLKKK